MTNVPAAAVRRSEWLGHPRGLAFLFATELWERFSYYGMRALLVLYMIKYLLLPGHAEAAWGFLAIRGKLETAFGPLSTQALASQIYGLYTGLVYLTPVFGGLLADRVLGQRRTVVIGAVLMAFGHFMMAFESLFFLALLLLILGNGAFKPNIATQIGGLYPPGDSRIDRAYSIFYVGINLGAFLAPLVCGTLGEAAGWHYGFTAAGFGMLIGLAIYLRAAPLLPADPIRPALAALEAPHASGLSGLARLLLLCVPVTLFWATYEQQGNTIALWADEFTDRTFRLGPLAGEIPTTWFQAFNPFMIFAFTPLVIALWAHQARGGREPSTVTKLALGCFGVTLANLILAWAAVRLGAGERSSWLWLFGYFIVITVGELYLSPTGLSLVSKLAPAGMLSMAMGFWLATSFIGNFMAGWLGSYWDRMSKPAFFMMIAGVAAVAGIAIWLIEWRWSRPQASGRR